MQTYVVLFALVAYVVFQVSMLVTSDDYRDRVLETSTASIATVLAAFFIGAYVLVTVVGCTSSGAGSADCSTFSWVLAALVVLAVIVVIVADMYAIVSKKDGSSVAGKVYGVVCGAAKK
jgi:uncharacterized membrane protein YkvI